MSVGYESGTAKYDFAIVNDALRCTYVIFKPRSMQDGCDSGYEHYKLSKTVKRTKRRTDMEERKKRN